MKIKNVEMQVDVRTKVVLTPMDLAIAIEMILEQQFELPASVDDVYIKSWVTEHGVAVKAIMVDTEDGDHQHLSSNHQAISLLEALFVLKDQ